MKILCFDFQRHLGIKYVFMCMIFLNLGMLEHEKKFISLFLITLHLLCNYLALILVILNPLVA